MKHKKMRLSREISGGEKNPQQAEGKTTWSIKQIRCTGKEHSLDLICDQLWFMAFLKGVITRGKEGEAVACTAPWCGLHEPKKLKIASGVGDFGAVGMGRSCH